MSESVVVALITGASAVVSNIVISRKKSHQDAIDNALREQRQSDRLDRIEKKVEEHNGYAKRFGDIEKAIVRIDTKLGDLQNEKNQSKGIYT